MPHISIFIDDRTQAILERVAETKGTTVTKLAEAAVESEAIMHLPGGLPGMHFREPLFSSVNPFSEERHRGRSGI